MHRNNTVGIRPKNPFTSGRTERFKRRVTTAFRGQKFLPPMNTNSNTNSNTSFNSRNNNSTNATKNIHKRHNATKNKPIRHNATKNIHKRHNATKNKNPILNHYYRQEKLNEVHTTIPPKQ